MDNPKEFFQENGKYIFIIVIVFFSLLTLFPNLGNTTETFDSTRLAYGGCKSLQTDPPKLDKWCQELSSRSCKVTSCCVLLNGKNCVAGDINGPTFRNRNGKNINYDYYYYKDKCMGTCPN